MTGRRKRRRWKLLDDLSFQGGRSRSHYVESSLWKKLRTFRKRDYLNKRTMMHRLANVKILLAIDSAPPLATLRTPAAYSWPS